MSVSVTRQPGVESNLQGEFQTRRKMATESNAALASPHQQCRPCFCRHKDLPWCQGRLTLTHTLLWLVGWAERPSVIGRNYQLAERGSVAWVFDPDLGPATTCLLLNLINSFRSLKWMRESNFKMMLIKVIIPDILHVAGPDILQGSLSRSSRPSCAGAGPGHSSLELLLTPPPPASLWSSSVPALNFFLPATKWQLVIPPQWIFPLWKSSSHVTQSSKTLIIHCHRLVTM